MSRRDAKFDLTSDEHAQLLHILRHTSAEDRLRWAEQMMMAFGMDHLKKCIDLKWKMEQRDRPFMPPPANDR